MVAIFLLITGIAAALDPRPLRPERAPAPSLPPAAADGSAPSDADLRRIRIRSTDRRASERRVSAGDHVILTVEVDSPGEVSVEGLDLVKSASEGVPAVFDLLAGRPGRYPVLFTAVGEEQRQLGVLEVEA